MKKIITLVLLTISSLFSKEYMAQIKPFESFDIKSQISGVAIFVDKDLESKYVNKNSLIIKVDSKDEEIELKGQKNLLFSQSEIVKLKERNYNAKNRIKQLSRYERDNEKLSFLESKKELINLNKGIKILENTISKKSFFVENLYINKVLINSGEYINTGESVLSLYDISKLKITLFLTKDEIDSLDKAFVYINGKKSEFKVSKIFRVKDDIRVSRYKVEFIKRNADLNNYFFDKLVTVELK